MMDAQTNLYEQMLNSYIAWISDLVVQGRMFDGRDVRLSEMVRARTLATLRVIHAAQKTVLLKFLYEAGLLGFHNGGQIAPLIALNGADLRGVDCSHYQMAHVTIISAFLNEASFSGAFLYKANLNACDLIKADFSHADLTEASMVMADLKDANLQGANLQGTQVSEEQIAQAANIEGLIR